MAVGGEVSFLLIQAEPASPLRSNESLAVLHRHPVCTVRVGLIPALGTNRRYVADGSSHFRAELYCNCLSNLSCVQALRQAPDLCLWVVVRSLPRTRSEEHRLNSSH